MRSSALNRAMQVGYGWLLKAAESGLCDAQEAVAQCLWQGVGTKEDKALAKVWYKRWKESSKKIAD